MIIQEKVKKISMFGKIRDNIRFHHEDIFIWFIWAIVAILIAAVFYIYFSNEYTYDAELKKCKMSKELIKAARNRRSNAEFEMMRDLTDKCPNIQLNNDLIIEYIKNIK